MAITDWFNKPASNAMLDNSFRNQFYQSNVQPVQSGATNVRPTNMAALKNWTPWKAFMPQSMGGTFYTGGTPQALGALNTAKNVGVGALRFSGLANPVGAAATATYFTPKLIDKLTAREDDATKSSLFGIDLTQNANEQAALPESNLADWGFPSGVVPGDEIQEQVTDQWTLPQTDWGPVKPTEPLPERGKLDMFLQKFGVPPMTQVTDADKLANKQFMTEQGIGRDPQTGRMIGGDFAGKNAPGTSGWGSANFGEMAQAWDDKYGDMVYTTQKMRDKQARIKEQAIEYAEKVEADRQERIRNERAAASAANQMTQRRPGRGGDHMSRSRDQGGLGISQAQAQAVSDANAAAGMGGWNLAYGGRVGYNRGGRVGILAAF